MRSALLLASLLALPATAALSDEIPGTAFTSGNWAGAGETGSDGAFLDCYVSVGYVNGEQFWVSLYGDDSLTVFLTQPGTTFNAGQNYPASLMTEVGFPVNGTAFAADANYIAFTLVGLNDSIDYLTQGSYVRLLGVGIDQSFDVRGLGGALAQARACLALQTTPGLASAAATTAPAPAPGAKPVLGSAGGVKPVQMSKDVGLGKPSGPPPRPTRN